MDVFSKRKYLVIGLFSLTALIIMVRLFYIQVIDSSYKISAATNVLRREINYPARGVIYDRNGKLKVFNQAAYDVLITPREVKSFDTLAFCSIVGVAKEELINEIIKAKNFSRYKPSPIIKQLSSQTYAVLQDQLFKYPGFYIQARTLRQNISGAVLHQNENEDHSLCGINVIQSLSKGPGHTFREQDHLAGRCKDGQ